MGCSCWLLCSFAEILLQFLLCELVFDYLIKLVKEILMLSSERLLLGERLDSETTVAQHGTWTIAPLLEDGLSSRLLDRTLRLRCDWSCHRRLVIHTGYEWSTAIFDGRELNGVAAIRGSASACG